MFVWFNPLPEKGESLPGRWFAFAKKEKGFDIHPAEIFEIHICLALGGLCSKL